MCVLVVFFARLTESSKLSAVFWDNMIAVFVFVSVVAVQCCGLSGTELSCNTLAGSLARKIKTRMFDQVRVDGKKRKKDVRANTHLALVEFAPH